VERLEDGHSGLWQHWCLAVEVGFDFVNDDVVVGGSGAVEVVDGGVGVDDDASAVVCYVVVSDEIA